MGLTQPEWFSKWKNVYESDWWWSGMNARNATMTATPTRCHQALMFESSLTRLTPKVLSSPWDSRMTANRMKVRTGVTAQPQARLAKAVQVSAAPKSIAAVTATSPRKEPPDVPGPDRLVLAGQPPGPEVQASCGRVDRTDLAHRQRDAQDEDPDQRPAERDRDRTTRGHRDPIARDAAGQYRDDRERDGEVGEPAHSAVQLLLVAELSQPGRVLIDNRSGWGNAHASPLIRSIGRPSATDESWVRRSKAIKGSLSMVYSQTHRQLATRGGSASHACPPHGRTAHRAAADGSRRSPSRPHR